MIKNLQKNEIKSVSGGGGFFYVLRKIGRETMRVVEALIDSGASVTCVRDQQGNTHCEANPGG
jgi:hypothetical protein